MCAMDMITHRHRSHVCAPVRHTKKRTRCRRGYQAERQRNTLGPLLSGEYSNGQQACGAADHRSRGGLARLDAARVLRNQATCDTG